MAALGQHEDVVDWLLEQQDQLVPSSSSDQQVYINNLLDRISHLEQHLTYKDALLSGELHIVQ